MIDLFINNQHLTILQSLIVDNSINYNTLKATFTDDWNGYNKWVHFKSGIAIYDVQLDSDDEIKQSEHLNFGSGIWEVWLHGTDEDGTIRITTDIAIITVIEGGIGDGEPLPDIPLSASEQIAITANNALNIAQSVRDDADNGEFDGISATISVGTTTTGEPNTDAQVTNVGDNSNAIFNFVIPEGRQGEQGISGEQGEPGQSATIAVGATTMLPEGSDATVTNVGDENNAIFDFGIPTGGGTNDYNDLINTPTKLSDFSNDVGYITNADIPTKTSDLTNDSGFISDNNYVHTDTNFTAAEKNKLNGLQNYDDTQIFSDLAAEANSRSTKDIALQSQIDGLTARGDVVDIVGTKAELDAYNTQYLTPNDKIKVLQDESRNDESTYYRWDDPVWTFVSSEGNKYTKAETDEMFSEYTKTSGYSAVAFSGSYSDLTGTPTIPTATSQLTNDSDYTTKTYVDGLISQISQQVDTINGEVI